jgi:hypothetical protein
MDADMGLKHRVQIFQSKLAFIFPAVIRYMHRYMFFQRSCYRRASAATSPTPLFAVQSIQLVAGVPVSQVCCFPRALSEDFTPEFLVFLFPPFQLAI